MHRRSARPAPGAITSHPADMQGCTGRPAAPARCNGTDTAMAIHACVDVNIGG